MIIDTHAHLVYDNVKTDEILKNMPIAQDIAKNLVVHIATKYPCFDQMNGSEKTSLIDEELQKLYYEKLSDIAREADRAFEEYKILVSYEKFGKLFEKYLMPEAIMV